MVRHLPTLKSYCIILVETCVFLPFSQTRLKTVELSLQVWHSVEAVDTFKKQLETHLFSLAFFKFFCLYLFLSLVLAAYGFNAFFCFSVPCVAYLLCSFIINFWWSTLCFFFFLFSFCSSKVLYNDFYCLCCWHCNHNVTWICFFFFCVGGFVSSSNNLLHCRRQNGEMELCNFTFLGAER